ncbi:MAG: YggS family pyridoxal phosphate-dependent enzyme [bacterium]|nr:YggS family pyridoxal phosphate-dependent enzyme [bacterium]
MPLIAQNLELIRKKMQSAADRAGRSVDEILLIAVSKRFPEEAVREAFRAGQTRFGENRVQEAEQKIPALADLPLEWHFIGHLQTNKVKKIIPLVHLIHGVDNPRLVAALQQEAEKRPGPVNILLQVNVGGEEQKSGVDESDFESLLSALSEAPNLSCRGLMTVPPYEDDPERVRPYFRRLRELGERYRSDFLAPEARLELSMGMSHDFHVAIEEGATMIRVGTSIFGERV